MMAKQSGQETPLVLHTLVAIGASAGGIEALSTVLGALSKDFPAPIVVAQHLDPTRPSHLDAILARRTPLTVRLVTDVAPLLPATVYIVPSDRDIEISDHEVRVRVSSGTASNPSINRLFTSAAQVYGECLIAVILTGTGSDGSDGAREVKAAGGLVMIENPDTAAFPGMPRSLAPTTVDIVADLQEIGPLLTDLVAGTYVPASPGTDHSQEGRADEELLSALLAEVRQHSGIDFSGYRRPTIIRRLQRRMVVTKSPRLDDYQSYLKRHPEEYQRLVSSFLIKVTEFFRDPEFFRALREQVLPTLIAEARSRDKQLRLWSAGCATGEEAYSLAILAAEALGPELRDFTVRLFATDLDEQAVAFARQGIYPAAALAGVSEEMRSRYFTPLDGTGSTYEVKKVIRNLVTCGEHDLGIRPPFPHIDLVLCRNVLIYFAPAMQQHALALFAYALRPGGYLVLGKAESARAMADYLAPADPNLKLYRRVGETLPPPLLMQTSRDFLPPRPAPLRAHAGQSARHPEPTRVLANTAEQAQASHSWAAMGRVSGGHSDELTSHLVYDLPVGVVIVNRRYSIQTINSAALRLLDIYRPAIGEDLVHVAERIPAPVLRRIIDAAFRATSAADESPIVDSDPLGEGRKPAVWAAMTQVVTLETGLGERRDVEIAAYPYPPNRTGERSAAPVEKALLLVSDITSTVAARVAAELAAARDRSAPEQALHRQGEDVERLHAQIEQMLATNTQLATANQELGRANLELQRVTDEVLLAQEQEQASAEEIRTLNEELQASNEELETVNEELEATVEELHNSNDDLAVRTTEAQELANTADQQRQASTEEQARLTAILLSLSDAVLVVDPVGKPLLANTTYTRLFGDSSSPIAAGDAQGNSLPPKDMPQQRAARGETFVMEFTLDGEDGKRRYFEVTGQPIHSEVADLGGVIAIRDITERSLHRFQDEFLALASHELRTPLTPLLTSLQMLSKLFAREPTVAEDTHAREYLAGALRQVQHLRRLTKDLIDVHHLQHGGFNLETKRVPLEQVVAESVTLARMAAPEGQRIEIESLEPTALLVDGDAMRLEQVLMNLLSNALTYAPHSPRIEVRLERDGYEAVVQVQDTGPGISAVDLVHLFERFSQGTSTEERSSRRGLGLGLYIARELVVAHGGRLEAASVMAPNQGHGTTFTIRLPLAPVDASGRPDEKPSGNESLGRGPAKRLRPS